MCCFLPRNNTSGWLWISTDVLQQKRHIKNKTMTCWSLCSQIDTVSPPSSSMLWLFLPLKPRLYQILFSFFTQFSHIFCIFFITPSNITYCSEGNKNIPFKKFPFNKTVDDLCPTIFFWHDRSYWHVINNLFKKFCKEFAL